MHYYFTISNNSSFCRAEQSRYFSSSRSAVVITWSKAASFSLFSETPPPWTNLRISPFDANTAALSTNRSTAFTPSANTSREISNWGTPSNTASNVSSSSLRKAPKSHYRTNIRRVYRCIIIIFRVNHHSHFLSQTFLEKTQMGTFLMFGNQCFNFFFLDGSEDFNITFGIRVAYVQPELIELVRRSIAGSSQIFPDSVLQTYHRQPL